MQRARRRNSNLGLMIIVGTLGFLVVILLVAIVILVVSRQMSAARSGQLSFLVSINPSNQLDIEAVDPALALASLGGAAEVEVITEAIDKDRPENALSALLFNPNLTDRESAGGFLQLANAYVKDGNIDKAIFSYELAGTVATLAPDISDTAKADIFLQTGQRLIDLGEADLAKFYLDQAFTIASRSQFLQSAHRRTIFESLQKHYLAIGENGLARQSLNLSANPPSASLTAAKQTVLPDPQPVLLPPPVQEAEANRWRVAQELTALLVTRGGNAPQSHIEGLGDALVAEDLEKMALYDSELQEATQVSHMIDITQAKIDWLSIKYRVARGAYGMSLVPEWEDQVEQIRADLTKTYEALFALYSDLVVALPDVSQVDKATEERLRNEILAGELGRYPNYPQKQRQKQLLDATNQLIVSQPEMTMFVAIGSVNNEERYTLISLE